MGRSIFLSIRRKSKTFIYIKTLHAHAQGVSVFDSKEIVLSSADYSATWQRIAGILLFTFNCFLLS